MTVYLGFMKPLVLPSAALCFCCHDENASGLPQGESGKRGSCAAPANVPRPGPALSKVPTSPQPHGQVQPKWAESQLNHRHMSYNKECFKPLSFGLAVMHQLLTSTGQPIILLLSLSPWCQCFLKCGWSTMGGALGGTQTGLWKALNHTGRVLFPF